MRWYFLLVPLFLAGGGCESTPPSPTPENGLGTATTRPTTEPAEPGMDDYWYRQFHKYMSPELREAYLGTSRVERFERFGIVLLDFERRDALLRSYNGRLSEEDLAQYYALDSLEASRKFLQALGNR